MKKKPAPFYKKPWFPILVTVAIVPTGTMLWNYVTSVFAAPQEIKTVKEAVVQGAQTQEYLKNVVEQHEKKNNEQDAEIQKQKEISQLQIDSLKAIVQQVNKR